MERGELGQGGRGLRRSGRLVAGRRLREELQRNVAGALRGALYLEQVVAPQKAGRDAAAKARAEETVSEIAALSVRLHATLVKVGLQSG